MDELRLRPKSDYLQVANWEEVYVLTEHWQSDMNYFNLELHFLDNLIGNYLLWLTKDENVSNVQSILRVIHELQKHCERLNASVSKHLMHIEDLIENAFSHDENSFRSEHIQLEEDIADFTKDFRKLKKEVFNITEYIIESEKLQDLDVTF